MNRILIIILILINMSNIYGQQKVDTFKIQVYNFESSIFSSIHKSFTDSLAYKFECDEIDLISVSAIDSVNQIEIDLAPTRGSIFQLFDYEDFRDTIILGFFIEGSNVLFLMQRNDFNALKKMGNFEKTLVTPFLSFVKDKNNDCLSNHREMQTSIILESRYKYYFDCGLKQSEMSYIFEGGN